MGGEWTAHYRIYIERDEDGMFVVTCPALPGCVSQGASREEAIAKTREAIELYLESLREHGKAVPPGVEQELVEVAG
jgi:predicted RNase H-like HicB family nuclease